MKQKYSVYVGESIPAFGRPVFLTVFTAKGEDTFHLEHYIFIERIKVFLEKQYQITYDKDETPGEMLEPNKWIQFAFDEALSNFENFCRSNNKYLFNRTFYSENKYIPIETTIEPIIRLHLLNSFPEELINVMEKTKSTDLQSELNKILKYPKFKVA